MPYAQVSDLEARYASRDLVQLTNEDPTAATVDAAFVTVALADASAEIDTYLESRFALPLADPPAVLVGWCCKIAMYNMQQLRPIHDLQDASDRYDRVIKQLEKVSDGSLTLGLATDTDEEPPPATPTVIRSGPLKMLTRGRLRGF
jgi:phage gp36-like protein